MKSYGQLWERIVSPENLVAALGRVTKGRGESAVVVAFAARADVELAVLRAELLSGTWRPGSYGQFRVTDPKPRTISCAPVRDRVVHHALCGVIAPLLERSFTEDCYACRVGKGTHRATQRARELVRRYGWICKLDIRRYFDSVPHEWLLELLLPLFREAKVRWLIETIVRHPVPGLPPGFGLPIGNLTSQWFANFYLSGLDHYAKEVLKASGYIRYMDDVVLFADGKAEVWRLHDGVCAWVTEKRGLEVKSERTVIAPVTEGLAFLGLRIFRGGWRLQRTRLLRTRRKFRLRERQYLAGEISGAQLARCAAAADGGNRWYGFRGILQSSGVLEDEGIYQGGRRRGGVGFEPRETGRKLEQHRVELSFGEPEQQRPVEPEQQHWLPPCEHHAVRTRRVPSADARASRKRGDEQVRSRAVGSLTFAGGANAAPGPFLSGTK